MPFGRRNAAPADEVSPSTAVEPDQGKGRPTPKRAEARKARRTAGATRSSRTRGARPVTGDARTSARAERQRTMNALRTGDERYLPARDAGPERRFARDFVDSRFTFGQMFFVAIVAAVFAGFLLGPVSNLAAEICNLLGLVSLIVIVIDSSRHARATKAAVAAKYGAAATVGIPSYAFLRAMYPRRFRRPPPKVARGGAPL